MPAHAVAVTCAVPGYPTAAYGGAETTAVLAEPASLAPANAPDQWESPEEPGAVTAAAAPIATVQGRAVGATAVGDGQPLLLATVP